MIPMDSKYRSLTQLKADARGYLLGRYSLAVPAEIIFMLLSSTLSGGSGTVSASSVLQLLLYFAIAVICSLLAGVLQYGRSRLYMNLCCRYPARISDLFHGFRPGDNRPLQITILMLFWEFVCAMPGVLGLRAYAASMEGAPHLSFNTTLAAALVLIVLGLLAYYRIWLSLSQCYYLLLDFPNKPASEIVRLSLYLMRGQKMRLFLTHLSFLPVMLLCVLSFGVGLLWALPYINATLACFHLDLTRVAAGE